MGHLDPIAYTYDADYHCPECAERRFGRSDHGFIGEDAEDSEGNPVGIVAPWDEWWNTVYGECDVLACGTCGVVVDNAHATECEENGGIMPCPIPAELRV